MNEVTTINHNNGNHDQQQQQQQQSEKYNQTDGSNPINISREPGIHYNHSAIPPSTAFQMKEESCKWGERHRNNDNTIETTTTMTTDNKNENQSISVRSSSRSPGKSNTIIQ
jgi:hypothetical protein